MKVDLSRLRPDLVKRSTCRKSTVPSKKIKTFLLLKSKVASYLAKCSIVVRRNGIVVLENPRDSSQRKGACGLFQRPSNSKKRDSNQKWIAIS